MFLIDVLGRRKMLIFGCIGCILTLVAEMIIIARGLGSSGGQIVGVFFLFLNLCESSSFYLHWSLKLAAVWFACFQDGVRFGLTRPLMKTDLVHSTGHLHLHVRVSYLLAAEAGPNSFVQNLAQSSTCQCVFLALFLLPTLIVLFRGLQR
jgi:hypothetical protein